MPNLSFRNLGLFYTEFTMAATRAVNAFCTLPGLENREPCLYLVIRDAITGIVVFSCMIGNCADMENMKRYCKNALDKTERLFMNPDDVSAWQSRDFGNKKYGGAFRIGDLIIGGSGLPEFGDEGTLLWTTKYLGWAKEEEVEEILALSENDLYEPLRKKLEEVA
jgi:hypothetical protein